MSDAALELEDVEIRYGAVPAVRDLTLTVNRGEIVGLIGPNGAGKSTTLHAIMGVVPVAEGEIRLAGRRLRRARPEDVARAGVALVPEGRHVFPHLTVEENLRLGLAARRRRDGLRDDLEWIHGLFPVVETVFSALAAIRDKGVTILLVEQRAQLTISFADRTHVLSNGRLRLTLGPKDAGDTERLAAAYLS